MKTEEELRAALVEKAAALGSQKQLAALIGVHQNFISNVINGGAVTGKLLKFLGYKKSKTKLFEEIGGTEDGRGNETDGAQASATQGRISPKLAGRLAAHKAARQKTAKAVETQRK